MKLHLDNPDDAYVIRAYDRGQVKVNDEVLTQSVVVAPNRLHRDWPPRAFDDLAAAHFDVVLEMEPEIVLIGTGERLRFPSPALTAAFTERNIGVEVMDTGAACRTYNVLMAEGRRVAAALLMIG